MVNIASEFFVSKNSWRKLITYTFSFAQGALEVETQTPCYEIDHNEVNMKAANLVGQVISYLKANISLKFHYTSLINFVNTAHFGQNTVPYRNWNAFYLL